MLKDSVARLPVRHLTQKDIRHAPMGLRLMQKALDRQLLDPLLMQRDSIH
jgi:hypothetical protein